MKLSDPHQNPDAAAPEVIVIFDPDFGGELKRIWPGRAVWIVKSPANLPVIQGLWSQPGSPDIDAQLCLTSFEPRRDLDEEDHVSSVLATVDGHHDACSTNNPYGRLTVIGRGLTLRIRRELRELGFEEFAGTQAGFTAARSAQAATRFRD